MNNKTNFEQQFIEREIIQTSFGPIETLDIRPHTAKTDIPVLFAPGWRETPELERRCLEETYNANRRVLTLRHSVNIQKSELENDYPQVELQKAKTIVEFIDTKKLQKVDVITHSEGAINVSIAATMQPHHFRKLIFVTPAGIAGKNSVAQIAYGFTQHLRKSTATFDMLKHSKSKRKTKEKISLIANINLAFQEGKPIATYDIHPLLIALRKQRIKIAVLVGERDTVFPIDKIKKHLSKLSKDKNYGFDMFATKPGGHEFYSKPQEIMSQVENILQTLEQ